MSSGGSVSARGALLLVGGGGHCRAVIDVLERIPVAVAGIVDEARASGTVLLYPVLGCDEDLPDLRSVYSLALVTVGQIKTPLVRQKLFARLEELCFDIPTPVSPLARVSPHALLGKGSVVMHQALVNAGTVIGKNCIINSQALVEHDCRIGDHCHIATGAKLCGGVETGEGVFVGAGSVVREGTRLGKNCVVGMGVCVRHDVPDGGRYVG
ncbi:MAG: acetyltransferase [Desulfovibrio sp.]|jgi:sugar O-acyltransferase (sialic acid O-acetyltransferase NeuD family)|nr:acetyltransferase [Desulfovibrio sp.]